MKKYLLCLLISLAFAVPVLTLHTACTSAPVDVTSKQQQIANAVEDALSVGLVPVFTKNPSYLPAAKGVATALATFDGLTITPDDVNAVLAKTNISASDAQVVAGIVNAAWATYQRRYAQQVSASVRPDVRLFLSAVSAGILNAVEATPKPVAGMLYLPSGVPSFDHAPAQVTSFLTIVPCANPSDLIPCNKSF